MGRKALVFFLCSWPEWVYLEEKKRKENENDWGIKSARTSVYLCMTDQKEQRREKRWTSAKALEWKKKNSEIIYESIMFSCSMRKKSNKIESNANENKTLWTMMPSNVHERDAGEKRKIMCRVCEYADVNLLKWRRISRAKYERDETKSNDSDRAMRARERERERGAKKERRIIHERTNKWTKWCKKQVTKLHIHTASTHVHHIRMYENAINVLVVQYDMCTTAH